MVAERSPPTRITAAMAPDFRATSRNIFQTFFQVQIIFQVILDPDVFSSAIVVLVESS
jgi:hypothetical protein